MSDDRKNSDNVFRAGFAYKLKKLQFSIEHYKILHQNIKFICTFS